MQRLTGRFFGEVCVLKRTKVFLLRAGLVVLSLHQVGAFYFQSFETDSSGWFGGTARVMFGTHGVPSKIGNFGTMLKATFD